MTWESTYKITYVIDYAYYLRIASRIFACVCGKWLINNSKILYPTAVTAPYHGASWPLYGTGNGPVTVPVFAYGVMWLYYGVLAVGLLWDKAVILYLLGTGSCARACLYPSGLARGKKPTGTINPFSKRTTSMILNES